MLGDKETIVLVLDDALSKVIENTLSVNPNCDALGFYLTLIVGQPC
jgi:hypothetical protein